MRFGMLRYFARTSAGTVDASAAKALAFPMPDDVLEQFVIDHGLDEKFQCAYADLDLHAIAWDSLVLPAEQIIASSSKFDGFVREVAKLLREHIDAKPHPPCVSPESWRAWIESGTWRRSPVFLDSVLPDPSGLHLVEGHTRVGMLKGLLDTKIPVRPSHRCWVGRQSALNSSLDWVSVLEAHPRSFYTWLFDGIGEKDLRGDVANRLIKSASALRYTHSFLENLEGLMALASVDKKCGVGSAQLLQLEEQWRNELEQCAGRKLKIYA